MNQEHIKFLKIIEEQLAGEPFSVGGVLQKWVVIGRARATDEELIKLLLANGALKEKFFKKVSGALVFDQTLFVWYLEQKNYLNDSYTSYKNKVGLTVGGKYLKQSNEVALAWPFKDCYLEGGQSREEDKRDCMLAVKELLADIESEIKKGTPEFKVSEPMGEYVHKIFKDKKIRVPKTDSAGQIEIVGHAEWYAFNDNYGTPEEKAFVRMFAGYFSKMKKKYKDIYLLRNEREVKITNKNGQTFEPDFLLFCKPPRGKNLTWQIFIEPKGDGFLSQDKWKEEFLLEIGKKKPVIEINAGKYQVFGLPFYTQSNEARFEGAFNKLLELEGRTAEMVSDNGAE